MMFGPGNRIESEACERSHDHTLYFSFHRSTSARSHPSLPAATRAGRGETTTFSVVKFVRIVFRDPDFRFPNQSVPGHSLLMGLYEECLLSFSSWADSVFRGNLQQATMSAGSAPKSFMAIISDFVIYRSREDRSSRKLVKYVYRGLELLRFRQYFR